MVTHIVMDKSQFFNRLRPAHELQPAVDLNYEADNRKAYAAAERIASDCEGANMSRLNRTGAEGW